MSGVELCRRTRVADDEAPYVYFILMTGFGDRNHLLEGMEAGADDYQKKPVDLDELEARLVSAARVVALQHRLADRTSALRRDSRRFYVASRTDPLTGAGNRLRLDEDLAAEVARAQRYGHTPTIAMCDLDHFKDFNDRFGHLAGDDALRRVADTIRANLRAGDVLYRYGGEELVVVLPEQSLDDAGKAMERVRAAVEALAIPAGTGAGSLTVSVGLAHLEPGRDTTPSQWLDRADEALYRAKRAGRNRVER
jgi:diguanylate cyclase (GGDEF)-like protein